MNCTFLRRGQDKTINIITRDLAHTMYINGEKASANTTYRYTSDTLDRISFEQSLFSNYRVVINGSTEYTGKAKVFVRFTGHGTVTVESTGLSVVSITFPHGLAATVSTS